MIYAVQVHTFTVSHQYEKEPPSPNPTGYISDHVDQINSLGSIQVCKPQVAQVLLL